MAESINDIVRGVYPDGYQVHDVNGLVTGLIGYSGHGEAICVRSTAPAPDLQRSNSLCFAIHGNNTVTAGTSILFDGKVSWKTVSEVKNIRILKGGVTLEPILVGPGYREPPLSLSEQQARPFWKSLDCELIELRNVTVIDTRDDGDWRNNLLIVRGNWDIPGINSIGGITELDEDIRWAEIIVQDGDNDSLHQLALKTGDRIDKLVGIQDSPYKPGLFLTEEVHEDNLQRAPPFVPTDMASSGDCSGITVGYYHWLWDNTSPQRPGMLGHNTPEQQLEKAIIGMGFPNLIILGSHLWENKWTSDSKNPWTPSNVASVVSRFNNTNYTVAYDKMQTFNRLQVPMYVYDQNVIQLHHALLNASTNGNITSDFLVGSSPENQPYLRPNPSLMPASPTWPSDHQFRNDLVLAAAWETVRGHKVFLTFNIMDDIFEAGTWIHNITRTLQAKGCNAKIVAGAYQWGDLSRITPSWGIGLFTNRTSLRDMADVAGIPRHERFTTSPARAANEHMFLSSNARITQNGFEYIHVHSKGRRDYGRDPLVGKLNVCI